MESFPPNKNSCQFESHNEANESNILEKKMGCVFSKRCVKRPLSKRQKMVLRPIIA